MARRDPELAGELVEAVIDEIAHAGRRRKGRDSAKRQLRVRAGARFIAEALQKVIKRDG